MKARIAWTLLLPVFLITSTIAQTDSLPALTGLQFRELGPALVSGRIADMAIHPENKDAWYVATASGGIWKTTNHGNTFTPIFDQHGSYSIGCITIDPKNPNIIWVGTGENNNQRSVAYGDGVYKSIDAGKSWKNMGLDRSEHIGNILVHPENSDIVYVAAYGPLWSKGGDRGVYKTIDGGENWERILDIDEHTGINEVHMDPRNPELLYATAHQRRRHVWTYISGGPSSGIYKSTDGGENWKELTDGLPKQDMGRIGLEIAPSNPDIVYAMIEAEEKAGGFYKSTDRGASWKKQSDYRTSGNYYVEIYCDPHDENKIFSMDTWLHHSEDGGKTFKRTGEKSKHVDNHCIWINPQYTEHWIVGCDGGIYETWDHAQNWHYKPNLPITQFYKLAVDNDEPFYNVYGGTQDNNTIGGPSRTINNAGILNSDWFITRGGDGFKAQVDPEDPNIVYSQAQYGWLDRYDKQSGERVGIKPMSTDPDEVLKWNWDSPLLISPHDHKRLYFGANKLFRSDDRGNNWKMISPDLTRQIDRNTLKVMDKVWGLDAVAKNRSTSNYGNLTAVDESPLQEDRLAVGSDDGLLHFSDDAGENWRKVSNVKGVPDRTYVNDIQYSLHQADVVYAAFNNHKMGDFKPYLYKSNDNGRTWQSISDGLPERGSVYCFAEDHVDPELLFCGTEFGVYFSIDGGSSWKELKNGLPTIAVRDMEIQRRENDLVLATFGRGFYVLDDYTPLRHIGEAMDEAQYLFPIKDGLLYIESNPLGTKGKASQGEALYTAPNLKPGVLFTYYNEVKYTTLKEDRQAVVKELRKEEKDIPYPSKAEIMEEERDRDPAFVFVIRDMEGNTLAKIREKTKTGLHRLHWDARQSSKSPISLKERKPGRYSSPDWGSLVSPGKYTVELHLDNGDSLSQLIAPKEFHLLYLNNLSLPAESSEERQAFFEEITALRKSIMGAQKLLGETKEKIQYLEKAIEEVPEIPLSYTDRVRSLQDALYDINLVLNGNRSLQKRHFATAPSLVSRIQYAYGSIVNNRQDPTGTAREMYKLSKDMYETDLRDRLQQVVREVANLELALDEYGLPYTPGRGDDWKEE